ncbi:Maltase MalT [Maublancomyces gigas]|uniref:Maltase MalT n=1 Tax=Discina gigas TaxID=1032678 RepID=A0ABR3GLZ6_9PEZI
MTSKEKLDIYATRINSLNSKFKLSGVWVVKNLLRIAEDVKSERLENLITSVLSQEKTPTLTAADATLTRIKDLFGLKADTVAWTLGNEPHPVPKRLLGNLLDLKRALYDDESEATRRVAVDFVLLACRLYLIDLHHKPNRTDNTNAKLLRIFLELDMSVEVIDHMSTKPIRVTGRADRAFVYGTRDPVDSGTILAAIEAKRRETFSEAESQLLAYLAVLRQLHIQGGKTNTTVEGFFTDGERYTFMAIRNDGIIQRSHVFEIDVNEPGATQLKSIFNFMVTMLNTSSPSIPHAIPTKASATRDCGITDYDNTMLGKAHPRTDIPIPDWTSDSDDNLLDLPDLV